MKTKRYTSAILIALVFATASIQAQSARRPVSQDKQVRTTARTTVKKERSSTKARSAQPAKKSETQQARKQQANYKKPAPNNKKPAPNNNGRQYVRNQNANNNHGNEMRNGNGYKEPRQQAPNNKKPAPNNNGRQYVRNQNANNNHGNEKRNGNGYKEPRQQTPNNHSNNMHANNRPVSISTPNNPRSTYGKPNKFTTQRAYSAPVKTTGYYNSQSYYGGNYYHYAYPTTRVKLHYHNNTYVNNYNVLYYPSYGNIYWTRSMYRDYSRWYPEFHWRYNYGYRIQTISVFDAKYNMGEVAMVYGRVYASWYNKETDDYLLFFGGDFPYQQFTVVVPGRVARKFSWRPERYFLGEHLTITGLITTFDGSPEIVVKNKSQLGIY